MNDMRLQLKKRLLSTLLVSLLALFFFSALLLFQLSNVKAINAHPWAPSNDLYQKIIVYSKSTKSTRAANLQSLLQSARLRKSLLLKEMYTEPKLFLEHIFGPQLLKEVTDLAPKEIIEAKLLEKEYILKGRYSHVIVDLSNNKSDEEFYITYTNNHKRNYVRLYFANSQNLKVSSGSTIQVKGFSFDTQTGLITDAKSSIVVQNQVDIQTNGIISTAVILINFQNDRTQPYTKAEIGESVFTNTDSVRNFYLENSYNKADFQGDVLGWYELDTQNTPCDYTSWADEADQLATEHGFSLDTYDRFIYIFPQNYSCSWGGLGEIQGQRSWINGASSFTISHELGHNFGLLHSNFLFCSNDSPSNYGSCSVTEYGGIADVMGSGYYHIMTNSKRMLDWMPDEKIRRITTSGIYTLNALEEYSDGYLGLRIPKLDTHEIYFIDYRTIKGFDSSMQYSPQTNIYISNDSSTYTTIKGLKGTFQTRANEYGPGASEGMVDGSRFTDPINGIVINQISHSDSSVVLDITLPVYPTNTPGPIPSPTPNPNAGGAVFLHDTYPYSEDGHVVVQDTKKKLVISDDFSIEMWMKPEMMSDIQPVVNYAGTSQDNVDYTTFYSIGIENYDYHQNHSLVHFLINSVDGLLYFPSSATIIDDGSQWTHVAITKQSNNLNMYINGVLDNSYQINSPLLVPLKNTQLTVFGNSLYYGGIDDLRISNVARPVNALWNEGLYKNNLVNDANVLGLWNFDYRGHDSSSNGLDAQLYGEVVYEPGIVETENLPPTNTPTPTPTLRPFNQALYFETANQNICSYYDITPLEDLPDPFTVEFRFNADSHDLDQANGCFSTPLLGKGSTNSGQAGQVSFWITSCDKNLEARINLDDGTQYNRMDLITQNSIIPNKWYYVKLTRVSNRFSLYIDDELIDTKTYSGLPIVPEKYSTIYSIGSVLQTSSRCFASFTGKIDELRISNIERTTPDGKQPKEPFIDDTHTLGLWHFDNNLSDSSIYRRSGYPYGAYSFVPYVH